MFNNYIIKVKPHKMNEGYGEVQLSPLSLLAFGMHQAAKAKKPVHYPTLYAELMTSFFRITSKDFDILDIKTEEA